MKAIKARWKKGRIVPEEPVDWPEGCQLVVKPARKEKTLGIREEEWPTDPEGIAKLIARRRRMKPLIFTSKELAEWQAAMEEDKEFAKANWDKWSKEIEELF